ncbi:MAG: 6-bladed beta-propeller [Thioalkalivibrio sp.]|nr:6-bladed beta-propeller [Thioalkalivibrio sp.]
MGYRALGRGAASSVGRFVLSTTLQRSLLVVDPQGRDARQIGRVGEGPGEYRLPLVPFWINNDTLAFYDPVLTRLTLLDAAGRYISSEQHSTLSPSGQVVGWLGSRKLLVWQYESLAKRGTIADSSYVYRVGAGSGDGAPEVVIGFPKSPTRIRIVSAGASVATLQPYLWSPFFGYHHGTSQLLVAHSAEPSDRSQSQVELMALAPDGTPRSKGLLLVNARRLTAADRRRVTDSVSKAIGLNTLRIPASQQQLTQQIYLPPFAPPLRGMFVDDNGGMWLWLREADRASDSICRWQSGGTTIRCGQLPMGASPIAASSAGVVLIVRYDEDGVPALSRFRLAVDR